MPTIRNGSRYFVAMHPEKPSMAGSVGISIGYTPVKYLAGYAKVFHEAMICNFEIFQRKQIAY